MTPRFIAGASAIISSLCLSIGSVSAADEAASKHPDGKFLRHAAQGGMTEVTLGQMAADKAQSEAVRNFGQRMVTEHGKANQELQSLATAEGVTLPTEMNSEGKALQKKLSTLSGAEFDQQYMKEMVKDHKKDVSSFKKQAEQAKDEDVKNWAAKTLPTLQEHYSLAQTTHEQLKQRGSNAADAPTTLGSADASEHDIKNPKAETTQSGTR